jgi:hypothetical protein
MKSAGLGVDDIGLFKLYESFAGGPLITRGLQAICGTASTAVIERT